MFYKQFPIAGLPINLLLLPETAEVAFVVVQKFKAVYDMSTDKMIDAYFDMESFDINGNTYNYSTLYNYKELPDMLKWLQEQNLILD